MSVPNCPVHNVPMRAGKGGSFFCAKKNPDGSWCTSKAPAQGNFASSPNAGTGAMPAAIPTGNPGATPQHLLILGALDFAAKVYQGTGDWENALNLANQVFAGWKDAL